MKTKLTLLIFSLAYALPAMAGGPLTPQIPEPSILTLFAAAGIAVTVIAKFKK